METKLREIVKARPLTRDEKLHLPRCDDTIRTRNDRINITSRNNK